MRRAVPVIWLLLWSVLAACGGPRLAPSQDPDVVQVELVADAKRVAADAPVVVTLTTRAVDGLEVVAPAPAAEGLEVVLVSEESEVEGRHTIVTRRFRVFGEPGSYLLYSTPIVLTAPDGTTEELQVSPLALDIGVQGPTSELEGLATAVRPKSPRWWAWAVSALLLAMAAWALSRWLRREVPVEEVPLPPPHVEAIRAWKAVIGDATLDDHTRALRCSAIYRRYLERRYGWAATALTTREIRLQLLAQSGVTGALTERGVRLLRATDLLKFARQGGGEAFFESLDEDFRTFLSATRQLETPAQTAVGA